MAEQLLDADLPQLYMLAELIDQFWRKPGPTAMKEIRLAAQPYGLNPLDRNRLGIKVVVESSALKSKRAQADEPAGSGVDPRGILRGVS